MACYKTLQRVRAPTQPNASALEMARNVVMSAGSAVGSVAQTLNSADLRSDGVIERDFDSRGSYNDKMAV